MGEEIQINIMANKWHFDETKSQCNFERYDKLLFRLASLSAHREWYFCRNEDFLFIDANSEPNKSQYTTQTPHSGNNNKINAIN